MRNVYVLSLAQAQFMSDIAALRDGQWQWSGWLTPKGRVIALFAVLRHSAEHLDLIVLDADIAALATSLKRYVFRSKVSIEAPDDVSASGRFAAPSIAQGATAAIEATGRSFGTSTMLVALATCATGVKSADIIKKLFLSGTMSTINSAIDREKAIEIMMEWDIDLIVDEAKSAAEIIEERFKILIFTGTRESQYNIWKQGKTGMPSTSCPPLPGVTPPTTLVP